MTGVRDALLIATTRYADEGLTALRAPFADASDLEQVLNDPQLGDFRVLKLVDQPAMVVRAGKSRCSSGIGPRPTYSSCT